MKPLLCLVTGANSGIGLGLAQLLARDGHRVIVCCRTAAKAEAAMAAIEAATGSKNLAPLALDLSDPASIQAAVATFYAQHQHLDVLCNIAGAVFFRREVTAQGIEKNLAVNHLGPFQLTLALRAALEAAPAGRIVNVVGEFHRKARLHLDDLEWRQHKYSTMKAGATAMLLRVMFTHELARRLHGSTVTANCFHPGAVRSKLLKDFPFPLNILAGWVKFFFLTEEKGADTGHWLATSEAAAQLNGVYAVKRKVVAPSALSQDAALAQQLWEISTDYVKEYLP